MNEQNAKNIIEGTYDPESQDTLWSMARDFYNRKMLSVVIIVWVYALIFIGLTIFSGIRFFEAEQVREQLMYATVFICCVQFICLMKVFAWQMIHRNGIKREIRRLELRIVELGEAVKKAN